jgi:dTDP-4-amino-4,6-dideoxygalactose transaminase
MVLTDDEGLAQEIRKLRYHGKKDGDFVDIGCNSQMSTLTAAILRHKLRHYDDLLGLRDSIACWYSYALRDVVEVSSRPMDHAWSWSKFVIKTDKRDELQKFLFGRGIDTCIHYPRPLNQYRQFGFWKQETPIADRLSQRCLSLPIYPFMSNEEVDYVICSILMFFDKEK